MAGQSLPERIAERMLHQKGSGRKHRYLAIFLANNKEIQEAALGGWKIKTIWETLHSEGVFEGTYECFLLYFNKYIKKATKEDQSNAVSRQAMATAVEVEKPKHLAETVSSPRPKPVTSSPRNEFTYNPVTPKKEEII